MAAAQLELVEPQLGPGRVDRSRQQERARSVAVWIIRTRGVDTVAGRAFREALGVQAPSEAVERRGRGFGANADHGPGRAAGAALVADHDVAVVCHHCHPFPSGPSEVTRDSRTVRKGGLR